MEKQYKVNVSDWLEDMDNSVEVKVEGDLNDEMPYKVQMGYMDEGLWMSEADLNKLIKVLQTAKRERKTLND